ncbi:MAG: hypothetical protein A2038_15430 [Deltaproteobacteria bacterium GWA2_57_13]|nr:MAG: hypothetical protein A2038_15430 [Deltaproteobacteria bacterium GWA2_57_13]
MLSMRLVVQGVPQKSRDTGRQGILPLVTRQKTRGSPNPMRLHCLRKLLGIQAYWTKELTAEEYRGRQAVMLELKGLRRGYERANYGRKLKNNSFQLEWSCSS